MTRILYSLLAVLFCADDSPLSLLLQVSGDVVNIRKRHRGHNPVIVAETSPMERMLFLRQFEINDYESNDWKVLGIADEGYVDICSENLEPFRILCVKAEQSNLVFLDAVEAKAISVDNAPNLRARTIIFETMPPSSTKDGDPAGTFRSKFSRRILGEYGLNLVGVHEFSSTEEGARRFLSLNVDSRCKDWRKQAGMSFVLYYANCHPQLGRVVTSE